jgi:hypothetical protein
LSHWVHTAIGEGSDLPPLKCSSHWSLGLYLASVDSLRAIRCDVETKCLWSTPAHVHPPHAHTAGGAVPVSTSSESVSTTNGVTHRRHDSRVTAAAATLSTCIDRLESVLERGLAFDTNAFASTQVTPTPRQFSRAHAHTDGRTPARTHTHTHTHLVTLTPTCSLAHPLPGAAHTANTPSKT